MRLLKLIPDHTKIDFVGARFYAFGFDGLLTVIALVSLLYFGLNSCTGTNGRIVTW